MKVWHVMLLALLLALLMLAFSSLGSVGNSSVEGLGLLHRVNVKVLMVDFQNEARPVAGALVVIGDRRALTSSDGTATISVPPGRYSSYFKHPDPRLSVVVRELNVEGDVEVQVVFELRPLRLAGATFDWGGSNSSVSLEVEVPEADLAFASTPVIFGYSSEGELVRLSSTADDYSYFSTMLRPGERNVLAFEVHGEKRIAVILPSSYLPVQLVRISVSRTS